MCTMSKYNKNKTHMKKWKKSEINFLTENYSKNGIEYCCKYLNRTPGSIFGKLSQLNIYLDKQILSDKLKKSSIKNFEDYKINPSLFLNIESPEVAYFLGVL